MTDPDELSLTILGCATPYPRPGEPCSGYLVQAATTVLWVDAGSGTLAALQEHVDLSAVDGIWITHLHPDHVSDLTVAWNAYANDADLPRPVVYGPPGWQDWFDVQLPGSARGSDAFHMVDLADNHTYHLGALELQAASVNHSVPTYALRATYRGRSLVYSGDTGPCPAITTLADRTDLLVIECGADEPAEFHCTPENVASLGASAAVARIVATHLGQGITTASARERIRASYRGGVVAAFPGLRLKTP
ncbi:MBL fold metallo-hydrolase [Amycolatopsis sp. CA-230715]|uniref:MBL fold metallo-hydrolase n=1 Tax=Amycolatopsis sp. CA-230715 TaxID=2745196 RepID=UPI001C01437F|nr:MBL fold metallo-hydrolase [Amycolatopsis sp. CA-230715]QWF85888.1 hypothetical protein HUW46_09368 [Amycolatopsis sp. CA-230715]